MGAPALVGREEPLRRLLRALDETLAGIGRLVVISGESGVGKTRLALELLDEAEARGARTAVGACWDGAGAPGMWPWVQVLRAIRGRGLDDEALLRLLDTVDVRERTATQEFHLYEATLRLLTQVCDERPLVVLLDDLQWADSASLALAEFLHRHAVHLPLLIVGTSRGEEIGRPEHPHHVLLADLMSKAMTVPLAGLDNEGIRRLREDLGVSTTTAEAEHLRRLTGGNPFFVIESVAFSDPSASLGVRRALDRRIDALGDLERHVLTVASLIGREAPDVLIAAVVGAGADIVAALAGLDATGLMRGGEGVHEFVHDLVREAMQGRLRPEERRELLARIVEAAEAPGVAGSLLPAQLAWLATQAVPNISRERAVELLEAAAQDALSRLTVEAAGVHYEQAAALTDDPDDWARLTLESGHAYRRAGALALARDRYTSLLTASAVATRANALIGLHRVGDPAAGSEPSAVVRGLDEIDAELGSTDDLALRAEVRAARSRARTHLLADDRSDSRPMAAEALDLARAAGDEATVASCLLAYHDAIWEPGTEDERRDLADQLATSGRRLRDPALEAQGLLLRMVAEIENGDPRYRKTHEQFDAVSRASQSPRLQFVAASRRGMVAALGADLPAARAEIDAARALGERIGEPDAISTWCDQRWQVARHEGDRETIEELLATLQAAGDPHWRVYDAVLAGERGDVEAAQRAVADIALLGELWPRWAARLWDTFSVEVAIVERDLPRIDALVERLEADVGHWAVLGGGVLVHGPVSAWLGRLEAARGNWERAESLAADAEVEARRLDAHLWLLEARADRLVAQHASGGPATPELAATIASARHRGLRPIVDRLDALAPARDASATNVFRRDHDVWTLVFDGVRVQMPDAKGLRDLYTLVANPRVEVSAVTLATDAVVSTDTAPLLDAAAKAAYRRRLDELDQELDRAALRGDATRAGKLEDERAALLDELRRAAGLGRRDRTMNSDRERLRKAVTARIRDTLGRLDTRHPALASHLRASVHTGAMCVYAPLEPVRWDLGG
ncbi:MAG TPA: AAA family ATPase [Acidimicrobiales bacterium]|nr:AAA family ATPase [Acidimicrobiales bacterium]